MEQILSNALGELFTPMTAAYALAAIGIAMHFGFTGLLNFGQAAYMLVGAYAFAMANLAGLGLVPAILLSFAASIVLSLILGIPTLRLRSDYLAIVTIAAAEILRFIVSTTGLNDVTGGPQGLSGFAKEFYALNPFPVGEYGFWAWTMDEKGLWVRVVAWSLVILGALFVAQMIRSPWGRVIKGIREDEDAVRSLGKNVYSYKMQSLIIGGLLGTLAGIVFVLPRAVQPGNYGTGLTFFIWTILLLGGASTVLGPIIGSMIFWVLLSLTEGLLSAGVSSGVITFIQQDQIGGIRFMLVGLGLMLLVIFRPQGIFGNKKELYFNA
jgi:neutral amino acid transport system permease protein